MQKTWRVVRNNVKICDVTMFWSSKGGGVRKYIETKKNWLKSEYPQWKHLLVIPGLSSSIEDDGNHRVITISGSVVPFAPGYRIPLSSREIVSVLEKENPDFIECGSPFTMRHSVSKYISKNEGFIFDYYHAYFPRNYIAALGGRLPFLNEVLEPAGWNYLRKTLQDSTRIFVASGNVKNDLLLHGVSNTEILPLGVDLETFRESDPDEHNSAPVMLFVGRLGDEKGLSLVIKTYEKLKSRINDLKLRIVGDGIYRGKIEKLAAGDENIDYPGFVEQHELSAIYRSSTVLVSGAPAETFGLTFLEALASGIPVVGLSGSGLIDSFPDQVVTAVSSKDHKVFVYAVENFILSTPSSSSCRKAALPYGWRNSLENILRKECELAGIRN